MKVLLIAPLPPPAGGIASWTKKYLKSKLAEENNIIIVNTAITGKRVKEYHKRKLFHEIMRTNHIMKDIKKQLKQNDFDVVHLNCACGRFGSIIKDYLFALTVKKKNIRLIVHFHCDVPYMVDKKTDLFFFKRLVKIADTVLTLNESSEQFTSGVCKKKSINIPNFVSEEFLDSILTEKLMNNQIKTVLYAGHVQDEKGCDVIYETARLFSEIEFILLGLISAKYRKAEKPDNVRLYGEVSSEQVKYEMLKADLLLFPTHTEGFPNVVVEAMACGMPIISTPVGAIPDMIENYGGILVPVNDVNAVAEAISFLQDKNIRKQMSSWNRQKVKNCYTTDQVIKRLFKIYRGELC